MWFFYGRLQLITSHALRWTLGRPVNCILPDAFGGNGKADGERTHLTSRPQFYVRRGCHYSPTAINCFFGSQ
jgi:hypothetical protein